MGSVILPSRRSPPTGLPSARSSAVKSSRSSTSWNATPRLKPVLAQGALLLGAHPAQQAADLGAAREEVRGLAVDDLEVLLLGDVHVAGLGQLVQLALDHAECDVAEQANHVEGILGERERHRLDVEIVAEEDRDVVAPPRVHGQTAAAEVRLVDDVVVHERRGVDELHHRGVEHRPVAGVAGEPGRHQEHGRPHALAAARLDVLADLRNQLDPGLDVARELPLDGLQIGADRLEDLGEVV